MSSEEERRARINLVVEALEDLMGLLRSGADFDRVIDGYILTRRRMSEVFCKLAQEQIGLQASALIESARLQNLESMKAAYGPAMPEDVLFVRSYGEVHTLLLTYLMGRLGAGISSERLRVATGDQVHTERRIRELRDLGFNVEAIRAGGEQQYRLVDMSLDLDRAAAKQLRSNIKASTRLSDSQKTHLASVLRGSEEPGYS